MGWGLKAAVGLTDAGTQCPNAALDQQQVAELLDAIPLVAGGSPLAVLPPIESGRASQELCNGIELFQSVQAGIIVDSRVDVDGRTWRRLMELGRPSGSSPFGFAPLLLTSPGLTLIELPRSASGWPNLTFTIDGPVAEIVAPGIRITLSVKGPVKVDWGSAYPVACTLSPSIAALDFAVSSGNARWIGGAALDTLSGTLQAESRTAIGEMFAAVTLLMGPDGMPVLGGSIGDATSFSAMSSDPYSIVYTTSTRIVQSRPVTGGVVQLTGDLELELRISSDEGPASVGALIPIALAAVVAARFLLPPIYAWSVANVPVIKEFILRLPRYAR